eukprot:scaffold91369_cov26-Prasinocladus_malaysianus.AAC.1
MSHVQVFPDADAASAALGKYTAGVAAGAISARGAFTIAIAGGSLVKVALIWDLEKPLKVLIWDPEGPVESNFEYVNAYVMHTFLDLRYAIAMEIPVI